jgi:predicted nucleic acid-binding protein
VSAPPTHPITAQLALLAGQIKGESEAKGVSILFSDLLIGVTPLANSITPSPPPT